MLRLAVLVSGAGTTMDAIAEAIAARRLDATIAIVLSDRPGIPALEKAHAHGLPSAVRPRGESAPADWAVALDDVLRDAAAELVVLAGFLSVLPEPFVARWEGRVINLHPSLLPRHGGRGLYGERVHRAVLAAGDRETGATVHLVTPDVDEGLVLAQAKLPVAPDDTPASLRARLAPVERKLLIATIARFASGELPLPYLASAGRP